MAGRFRVRIPTKARLFRFFRASSPSVEPKWPYTRCVQGANFSGLKRLERNVGHSTVSNVEAENKGDLHLYSPGISSRRGWREFYCFALRIVY
jgi:hypothetical protein